jgi:hypothetical protein
MDEDNEKDVNWESKPAMYIASWHKVIPTIFLNLLQSYIMMKAIILPLVLLCTLMGQSKAQTIGAWSEKLNNLEQITDPNNRRVALLDLNKSLIDLWNKDLDIEVLKGLSSILHVNQSEDKQVTILSFGTKTYKDVFQFEWLVKIDDQIWPYSEELVYHDSKGAINLSCQLNETSFETKEFNVLNGKQKLIHVLDVETKCLFEQLQFLKTDQQKDSLNLLLEQRLNKLWGNVHLFEDSFSGIKRMKTIHSDDGKVKICTYNIQKSNFTQQFYGAVILKDNGMVSVLPLTDETDKIRSPERSTLSNKKWYGAIYIDLIENSSGNKTYYTLIGYKGHDEFVKKRVLDVMMVQNGRLRFGAPIFKTDRISRNRVVFQYSAKATMMLRYDSKAKVIVFDNLVPADPMYRGVFHYYGPDFSYNGFKFTKGVWELKKEIDLRNPKQ